MTTEEGGAVGSRPPRLPVMLDIADERCTVVGGGPVGAERARTLKEHGARVTVVSPETSAQMAEMLASGDIEEHRTRPFRPGDVDGCALVVAATDDVDVNADVARAAAERGVACNVAGTGPRGSAIFPAAITHGPLAVSVSTTGASPRFARLLRDRIGRMIDPSWGELAEAIGELRREIEALPRERRDAALERMLDGPARAMLKGGAPRARALAVLRRELER